MSWVRKAIKVAAQIAVEEIVTETTRGAAKDLGEALGADISRAYRKWRNLPEPKPKSDDGDE